MTIFKVFATRDETYRRARRQNLPWSLRATKYLLSAISAATTGVGLAFVFAGNARQLLAIIPGQIPIGMIWLVVGILAFMLTLMIQALVLQMWERVFSWRPLGLPARLLALVMAVGATLTSILFASGSYRVFNDTTGITAYMNRAALQASARIGEVARNLAATFGQVASHSRELANAERQFGGTCEGTRPMRTCGVRCRMRERIAREAEAHRGRIIELAGTINALVRRMKDESFARDTIAQANRTLDELRLHSPLPEVRTWAVQQRTRFAGREPFVDPQTGMRFHCRDKRFASDLARLEQNLATMQKELANANFVSPQNMPLYPAVLQIIELAWDALTSLDFTRMPGQFWVAAAVDVSIILLIFIMHAEWDAPTRAEYERFRNYRQIRPFILKGTEEAFLLVPVDGHEGATRLLENMALLLRLKQPPELSLPMALDEMAPDLARHLGALSGGATAYHFYALPPRKERLLYRYLRRLALGDEIYAPPSLPPRNAAQERPSEPPVAEGREEQASA